MRKTLLSAMIASSLGVMQPHAFAQTSQPTNAIVEVIHDSAALYVRDDEALKRRGSAKLGSKFATQALTACHLCASGQAFVLQGGELLCSEDTAGAYRRGAGSEPVKSSDHVRYAKVAVDGTPVYAQFDEYLAGEYISTLGQGFQVIVETTEQRFGKTLAKIKGIGWVENDSLHYQAASQFAGKMFAKNEDTHIAWLIRDAYLYRAPKRKTKERIKKYTLVHVKSVKTGWVEIGGDQWLRDEDVGRLRSAEKPASINADQKWIDVDLSEQVLTAYAGDAVIFATLVSTGRLEVASQTPTGEFHLWVKLLATDMANIEDPEVQRSYSVQDVPWVQFFKDAYGLHGTYWHDDFGTRKSHGCVNLSPTDAEFLFFWTEPSMPAGWSAIIPLAAEQGTLIRIHD